MVPPGNNLPSRSAAAIIARAGRSLTLPPGFMYSSFTRRWQATSRAVRCNASNGVSPTRSRRLSAISMGGPGSVAGRTSMPLGTCIAGSSVNTTSGRPASWTWAATAAAGAPRPKTTTSRGSRARNSASVAAGRLPSAKATIRLARAVNQ